MSRVAGQFHIKTAHGKFLVVKGNEADGTNASPGPRCVIHFEDRGGGQVRKNGTGRGGAGGLPFALLLPVSCPHSLLLMRGPL